MRAGMIPDHGFSIGFDEGGDHATIHVIPRRAADRVELAPGCTWVRMMECWRDLDHEILACLRAACRRNFHPRPTVSIGVVHDNREMAATFPFPKLPHHAAGRLCSGFLLPEPAESDAGESKTALRCDECGEIVGTMNTWPLSDLASLALAGRMDTFVPDATHINALPDPVRRYVHDLATRADLAGDIAEIALLKENNAALWKRVQELEDQVKQLAAHVEGGSLDLAAELQRIYDSEINIRIAWFWDAGFELRLGDEMNGYEAEENVSSASEILPWLQEAIVHFYPESSYAASLDPTIAERGKSRLFRAPRIGARAVCPHCGAPNASTLMDELFAFVCARCGAAVTLDPPKIQ